MSYADVIERAVSSRRGFLKLAAATWPLGRLTASRQPPTSAGVRAAAIQPDEGELFYVGPTSDPVRIKVSPPGPGRVATIVQEMAIGSRVPVHLHEKEDEVIFIQRGSGLATLGDRTIALRTGSMLFVPQGTWHGGENTGTEPLLWVATYAPSGFEGYFREIGVGPNGAAPPRLTPEEREARDRKYGIRYPG
jgi:mannose-6-phosphate isomerase-like protein (cupin superfamily)